MKKKPEMGLSSNFFSCVPTNFSRSPDGPFGYGGPWSSITGIGVDTRVQRIIRKPTKEPEDIRKAVEEWLPRDYRSEISHLLDLCSRFVFPCDQNVAIALTSLSAQWVDLARIPLQK